MPTETGFDLLASVENKNFEVIFVTAHDDFALKALRVNAVDYLLKPIDVEELKEAVKRATEKIVEKKKTTIANNGQLDVLADMIGKLKKEQEIEKISLNYLGGFKLVAVDDIMYLEGDGIGIVNSRNQKTNLAHKSRGLNLIKERLDLLQEKFNKAFTIENTVAYEKDINFPGNKVNITIPLLYEDDIK
jgi:YesN/AraC family two-component response regulator